MLDDETSILYELTKKLSSNEKKLIYEIANGRTFILKVPSVGAKLSHLPLKKSSTQQQEPSEIYTQNNLNKIEDSKTEIKDTVLRKSNRSIKSNKTKEENKESTENGFLNLGADFSEEKLETKISNSNESQNEEIEIKRIELRESNRSIKSNKSEINSAAVGI